MNPPWFTLTRSESWERYCRYRDIMFNAFRKLWGGKPQHDTWFPALKLFTKEGKDG